MVADYEKEKGGPQDLSVKSGDMVQLIKEGGDGQWFVRNLGSNKDGWVAAANLLTLITESKSSQSLCSSGTLAPSVCLPLSLQSLSLGLCKRELYLATQIAILKSDRSVSVF